MGALKDHASTLAEIGRVRYESAFLIEDLLTAPITILAGEPKAGKSLLVCAMIEALLNGHEEFLGLKIYRQLGHVVIVTTDDGAKEEIKERLHGVVSECAVTVVDLNEIVDHEEFWTEAAQDLVAMGAGLVVVDNMLGALDPAEDVSSNIASRTMLNRLRRITRRGIPVLLVTHTPKGTSEGLTVASAPIGSRAIAGGVRGIIVLRRDKNGRRIETAINRAKRDRSLAVTMIRRGESEACTWALRDEKKPSRNAPAARRNHELAMTVVNEAPSEVKTMVGAAEWLREHKRARLSAGALRTILAQIIEHRDGRWQFRSGSAAVA